MIGKEIIQLDVVDSTNNYIKANEANMAHGTIVVATKQTKGRGRGSHTWESEYGNLYFSTLLKKEVSYESIFDVLMNASVAVIHSMKSLGIQAQIKYPNDILVKNNKISGILIETYGNLTLEGIIVGIGINVNQKAFGSLQHKATSVVLENNCKSDVKDVLSIYVKNYNAVLKMDTNDIYEQYIKHSMVIGKQIDYENESWMVTGILNTGELVVKNKEDVMRLSLNEVNLKELYNETNN